jgi:hypothetical protein
MLEKVLHHKLLKEGEQGQGVITEKHDQGSESSGGLYSILFEVKGHIKFPDGTETQFQSELLSSHKVGSLEEGAIVPVRYNPADRSQAVLDVVALEEAKSAEREQAEDLTERQKQQAIADADAKTAEGNA